MIANNRPKAVVMGLGKSGLSCARYLLARGYEVEVTDTREQPPMLAQLRSEFPDVTFIAGNVNVDYLNGFNMVVTSPGLSIRQGAIAEYAQGGGEVIGDIEIFARHTQAPVIAITGANGKSTVTMLVGHILSQAMKVEVGGNIGTPALDLLDKPVPDVYVLELSSFQLETTYSLNARAAVVLNISEDHMDRYDDIADYATSKQRIFSGTGVMVLNRDDAVVAAMRDPSRKTLWFTASAPRAENEFGIGECDGEAWLLNGSQALMPVSEVPLAGRHNQVNVLAALALIDDFDLPLQTVRRAVRSFKGLPHRCEIVAEFGGVQWINDSKATNVGATAAALAGMDRPVVLIAGGEGKDADFSPLADAVRGAAHTVVLIGRDAGIIEQAIGDAAKIKHAGYDMNQAMQLAFDSAKPGDAVLLSPACASFDMFNNFEHRGQVFAELVNAMMVKHEEAGQ